MKKACSLFLLISLAVFALDQITKLLINRVVPLHESIPVIKGLFNIVHVRNRGMVFGIMNKPEAGFAFYILVVATIIAVILLFYWFIRLKEDEWHLRFGLSLILGGALGNLLDRLRMGEVIDFMDFFISSYHWPAFNIADASLTAGTIWIAINLVFFQKQG